MHCGSNTVGHKNSRLFSELSQSCCVYLNLIHLLFCLLLCRFSMLCRTLLSGQSDCSWEMLREATMTEQQSLTGQSCQSPDNPFTWNSLHARSSICLLMPASHETILFVYEAMIENMICGWSAVMERITLWQNFRHKSTLSLVVSVERHQQRYRLNIQI